jgi:hypothetical protein
MPFFLVGHHPISPPSTSSAGSRAGALCAMVDGSWSPSRAGVSRPPQPGRAPAPCCRRCFPESRRVHRPGPRSSSSCAAFSFSPLVRPLHRSSAVAQPPSSAEGAARAPRKPCRGVGAFLAGPSCRGPLLAVLDLPALEPSVAVGCEASVRAGPQEGFGLVPLFELDSFHLFQFQLKLQHCFKICRNLNIDPKFIKLILLDS